MKQTYKPIKHYLLILLSVLSLNTLAECEKSCCGSTKVDQTNKCPLLNDCNQVYGQNIYVPRPQGNSVLRRRVGVTQKEHLFCMDKIYGVATATFEYQKNMRADDLACWFTTNGTNTMTYGLDYEQGQPGAGTFDINALNFGVTSSGVLSFHPKKTDFIADLYVYLSWDEYVKGLWTSVEIPITYTKWSLGMKDCAINTTNFADYPENSVGAGDIPVVYNSSTPMLDAFKGLKSFGNAPMMSYGRINCQKTAHDLAGLRFDIGYEFVRTENFLFTPSLDFILPTGTVPNAQYVFDAIAGNYDRWECGMQFLSEYVFWKNCDRSKVLSFDLIGNINHVFAKSHARMLSLDIPNVSYTQKLWSQYLTLKTFNYALQATGLQRAANILEGNVTVNATAEGSLYASIDYNSCSWLAGFGWEFWGRTAETLQCRDFVILENTYAIQGSTQWNGNANDSSNNLVAPSTTISKNGTAQPIANNLFLTNESFLYTPALHPSVYSNKIFAYAGKNWQQNKNWQAFGLMGVEVEIAQQNRSFSMWAVFGKLGIEF